MAYNSKYNPSPNTRGAAGSTGGSSGGSSNAPPPERKYELRSIGGVQYKHYIGTTENVVTKSVSGSNYQAGQSLSESDISAIRGTERTSITLDTNKYITAGEILKKNQQLSERYQSFENIKFTAKNAQLFNQQLAQRERVNKPAIYPQPRRFYQDNSVDISRGKAANINGLFTNDKIGTLKDQAPSFNIKMLPDYIFRSTKAEADILGVRQDYLLNLRESGGYKGSKWGRDWNYKTEREIVQAEKSTGIKKAGHYYNAFGGAILEEYTKDPKKTAVKFVGSAALGFGIGGAVRSGVIGATALSNFGKVATGIYGASIAYGTYKSDDKVRFLGSRAADISIFGAGALTGAGVHAAYVRAYNWKQFNYNVKRDYGSGKKWKADLTRYEATDKFSYNAKTGQRTYKTVKIEKGLGYDPLSKRPLSTQRQLQIRKGGVTDPYKDQIKPSLSTKLFKPSGQTEFLRADIQAKGITPKGLSGVKAAKVRGSIIQTNKLNEFQYSVKDYMTPPKRITGLIEYKPPTIQKPTRFPNIFKNKKGSYYGN